VVADLEPGRLREMVTGVWGASLTVEESTASTMDDAITAAAGGAPDGHVVLADTQTKGRGAHGRSWVSPPGSDLYFSIVARPRVEPASVALVTLATGLGVADVVAASLPRHTVQLKWPNDVWVARRKCAGVLVESRTLGNKIDSLIIGIGLNVNRTEWPAELEGIATSLRAEAGGEPFDRAEVFAAVVSGVERWVRRLVESGPPVIVNALQPRLALVGERARWQGGEGVFEGVGPDGAARVRTSSGVQSLHAGRIEPLER